MTVFYLGTHQPHWLADERFRHVPLFISSRRLMDRKTLPKALGPWALDSGAFSEIRMFGRWTITTRQYVDLVTWYAEDIGMPDFIASMDWMCEPWVIQGRNQHLKRTDPRHFHGTRAARGIPDDGPDEPLDDAILKHLRWTVDNFAELCDLLPPRLAERLIPPLQGWQLEHYRLCRRMYQAAGIDLAALPRIGLGSVCRRQGTREIDEIVTALNDDGLTNMHGFGVKTDGLELYGDGLVSADSQAWSDAERKRGVPLFPEHAGRHKNCANCPDAALAWWRKVTSRIAVAVPRPRQAPLFEMPARSLMPPVTWRRARRSQGNGECVEVARAPYGGVWLRDSKRPAGPTLDLSSADWAALVATIRAGKEAA